jgi:Ca-activated chloride channel family protein
MRCTLLFALCILTLPLRAQTPNPDPPPQTSTLTITTRLVSLDAVVRDASGDLVTNLIKDSFTLREDGHPVPIRYFNHDSDLPLTVGLLVDTSGSETEYFGDEAVASNLFLERVLRPAPPAAGLNRRFTPDSTQPTTPPDPAAEPPDRAFIVRFDSQVLLLQPMTSSLPLLRNGLRLLDYKPDKLKGTSHGGTLLFDAIITVCDKVIGSESGRRALIVMTDGDDNGSRNDLSSAIRSAQAAGVAVYSILYTRELPNYPVVSTAHPSGIGVMQQISRATGGRAFVVGSPMNIRKIYSAIEDDLRSQYRIGFTPRPSAPHRFHSLDLRATPGVPSGRSLSDGVSDPKLTVQSRTSYSTPE